MTMRTNRLAPSISFCILHLLMYSGGGPTTPALQRILDPAMDPGACRIGHPRGGLCSARICWPTWPMSDRGSAGAVSDGQFLRRDRKHVAQLHRHTAGVGAADGRGK